YCWVWVHVASSETTHHGAPQVAGRPTRRQATGERPRGAASVGDHLKRTDRSLVGYGREAKRPSALRDASILATWPDAKPVVPRGGRSSTSPRDTPDHTY